MEPARKMRTGRILAAVLHGSRNLKLEYIPEKEIQPTQVRVDVRYCGLTGSDALLWRGEHRVLGPTAAAVLGFDVSGTILEMGRLAHERTGYQMGEKVVVHNYPFCGGLAESCLVHYRDVFRLKGAFLRDATIVTDDYFSALLAMGRRARIRRNEYFLVNAKHSRSALAVIDLAVRVFGAKPIALCDDVRRAKLCADLGAEVVCDGNERCLPYKLRKLTGKEEVRLMIETEGGPDFRNVVKCLKHDGLVALLGDARDKRYLDLYLTSSNYTIFAVAAEHYKVADTLVYREAMQHVLDYHSECAIRPRTSAIFGLHRVNDAFDYYTTVPSGNVLIDVKDLDRFTAYDETL